MKQQKSKCEWIHEKLASVEGEIARKIQILEKEANFTQLLNEKLLSDNARFEDTLGKSVEDLSSFTTSTEDLIEQLRQLAENDRTQLIHALETELQEIEEIDEKILLLVDLGELLTAVESSANDSTLAMEYLSRIASHESKLHSWSGGKLEVLKAVNIHCLNKTYALESERRKRILETEALNKGWEGTVLDENDSPIKVDDAPLYGRFRETLLAPLEPIESVTSEEFGGTGSLPDCSISAWLRPLIEDSISSNDLELLLDLYKSVFEQMLPFYPLKTVAIFYSNSMYLAHRVLIETLTTPSRMSVVSATSLRIFAEEHFMRKVRSSRFTTKDGDSLDHDESYRRYADALRNHIHDLRAVLPSNVSKRLCPLLIDHFLAIAVRNLMSAEDIESRQADKWSMLLHDISKMISEYEPAYSSTPFTKVQELRKALMYSLKDFVSQWNDEGSRLRACFQATEVRHLIQAIFQNSDMKSSALSRIL